MKDGKSIRFCFTRQRSIYCGGSHRRCTDDHFFPTGNVEPLVHTYSNKPHSCNNGQRKQSKCRGDCRCSPAIVGTTRTNLFFSMRMRPRTLSCHACKAHLHIQMIQVHHVQKTSIAFVQRLRMARSSAKCVCLFSQIPVRAILHSRPSKSISERCVRNGMWYKLEASQKHLSSFPFIALFLQSHACHNSTALKKL